MEEGTLHAHSLQSLPVELLYEIFIYSSWHLLPHTSKHFYEVFKCSPSSVTAEYLLARHTNAAGLIKFGGALITKILRYPICTQTVLEALLRLPDYASTKRDTSGTIKLPRRLFRSLSPRSTRPWSAQDEPMPFLRYIYDHPQIPPPNANCWDGYALTRAVASGFIPLTQFLLEHGASPACKGGMAVLVAVRRKNLPLVKMLIQPDTTPVTPVEDEGKGVEDKGKGAEDKGKGVEDKGQDVEGDATVGKGKGKRRRQEEVAVRKRSHKRRKLEDRVAVSQEMLRTAVACDARDIVKYFIEEKSCTPDIQTVRMMRH